MTITVTPSRLAVLVGALLASTLAYVMGAAHGSAGVASATTAGPAVATTSGQIVSAAGLSSGAAGTAAVGGITVTGTGTVSGRPDTLRLDLTVSATAGTVNGALASANATQARVQRAMLDRRVATSDLQTSGLSIQPDYSYSGSGQPTLKDYQASEGLRVTLRDLSSAGVTIDAAVSAGGNAVRVDGIGLDLEGTGTLVSAARGAALRDAKTKATQYAAGAGRQLGPVVSMTEAVANPTPVFAGAYPAASQAAAAPVPLQAGTADVSVTVTVVFAFG